MHLVFKIILILALTGAVVWAVKRAPFIDESFKVIIKWVAIVGGVFWCLWLAGLFRYLGIHG